MDTDLANLRKTLSDVIEVISLTPQDQDNDLIDLKKNIEEIIALKEAEDRNQSKDPPADIFGHLPDNDIPGTWAFSVIYFELGLNPV